eukprot:m.339548 g.339548  ORF g.339548 m.339548 type:complete len:128 (+) comp18862_c0_seq1:111-494(+)
MDLGDADLEQIRQQRMAQLQNQNEQEQKREQQQRAEDMKNGMLASVMEQAARARLSSIALVKPEKAKMVESIILGMVQQGKIRGKIDEESLRGLLEQVAKQQEAKKPKITFSRRELDSDSSSGSDDD